MKLAIAAFMVPYVICYNPALILVESTPLGILIVTATTLIGLFALAAAFEGYLFAKVPFVLRLVFAAGGILLIAPETVTDVIGILLVTGAVVLQYQRGKRRKIQAA